MKFNVNHDGDGASPPFVPSLAEFAISSGNESPRMQRRMGDRPTSGHRGAAMVQSYKFGIAAAAKADRYRKTGKTPFNRKKSSTPPVSAQTPKLTPEKVTRSVEEDRRDASPKISPIQERDYEHRREGVSSREPNRRQIRDASPAQNFRRQMRDMSPDEPCQRQMREVEVLPEPSRPSRRDDAMVRPVTRRSSPSRRAGEKDVTPSSPRRSRGERERTSGSPTRRRRRSPSKKRH